MKATAKTNVPKTFDRTAAAKKAWETIRAKKAEATAKKAAAAKKASKTIRAKKAAAAKSTTA